MQIGSVKVFAHGPANNNMNENPEFVTLENTRAERPFPTMQRLVRYAYVENGPGGVYP